MLRARPITVELFADRWCRVKGIWLGMSEGRRSDGRANLRPIRSPGIIAGDEYQLGGILRVVQADCATNGEELLLFIPGYAASEAGGHVRHLRVHAVQ